MPIRVVLADDHVVLRQALKSLLEEAGMHVVAEASEGREAVPLVSKLHPDIVVLDISMPLMNGLEAARELHQASPKTGTIVLSRHDADQFVIAALNSGVRGYVLKTQATNDLIQAIRQVHNGEVYLSPGVSRALIEAFLSKSGTPADSLSPRERQVLQLIAEGKSTKEIATHLFISVKTVESHRTRLMQKLNIHDVASLVRYAIRVGLVEP
ncbi:MAG: response regulator transcription factor [Acidobacteria bacterium]|nr:response regulator transcription factor [Acidobacteriota bacterium]